MKKIMPIIVIFIGFIALAFYVSYTNAKTNIAIDQTWVLEDSSHQKIELYGTEQPVKVKIIETTNDKTNVTVSGNISKTSFESIKDARLTKSSLYVPLSKHGFRLYTSAAGKTALTFTIALGKSASFEEIFIDTIVGTIEVTVPPTFNGTYDVKVSNGAKLKSIPDTQKTSESTIKIDAYSDVRITKGE